MLKLEHPPFSPGSEPAKTGPMRFIFLIPITLTLAACGRPLTDAEVAYMAEVLADAETGSSQRF